MAQNTADQHTSLPEVHRSVQVPQHASKLKRLLAFLGPAYLVSVGYMDPGNWATDIEGGARFGYSLLWVLLMSNLMAVLLQTLSARLGIVRGRDLAQTCRDMYPAPVAFALWILCEVAIAACDLAEVLGTAIGLNLLFGMPLIWGVIITAVDTIFLLAIQNLGVRKFEAFILSLVLTIGLCFVLELLLSKPSVPLLLTGFAPSLPDGALYVAIGIIGATVMPHNLYLHSALVQTRSFDTSTEGKRTACKYNLIDSVVALNAAFFVNAAILILAATVFFSKGIVVNELQQAHSMLSPLLGTSAAGIAFAVALLAAGQSSTLTGTLAGQIVMEGFLNFKMRPFLRRLITRLLAVVPAVIVILQTGDKGTYSLLLFSQVLLSLQLPFAVIPLIQFTSDKERMGEFANPLWVKIAAWLIAAVIVTLNISLVINNVREWLQNSPSLLLTIAVVLPLVLIAGLLVYITMHPWLLKHTTKRVAPSWQHVVESMNLSSTTQAPTYSTIAIAIAHDSHDVPILRHAISLAHTHNASITIIHVVEGAVGTVFGRETYDAETRSDEEYILHLQQALVQQGIQCSSILGYGDAPKEIVRLVRECNADLLVMGGHGHKGWRDIIFGATISPVRHELSIPVFIVQ